MRPSRWRDCLPACALALAGCGSQVTLLTTTGPFDGLLPQSFEERRSDDGLVLDLVLTQAGPPATVTVQLTGDGPCWRSPGNQHACTVAADAGVIESTTVQAGDRRCALEGWVERLDDTWQLDLKVNPYAPCAEGRLAAVVVR